MRRTPSTGGIAFTSPSKLKETDKERVVVQSRPPAHEMVDLVPSGADINYDLDCFEHVRIIKTLLL